MLMSRLRDLRPRTVWDIVDDTFDLYRERFTLFAGIAAVLYVPAYLVYLVYSASASARYLRTLRGPATTPYDPFGALGTLFEGAGIYLPLLTLAFLLQTGATALAVEDHLRDRPTGVGLAYRRTLARLVPLLLGALIVVFLVSLAAVGSFFLLGIGGLLVLAYYAFVPQAVVLERRGAFAAGRRSRDLATRYFGKAFGLVVFLLLLNLILSAGIYGLVEMIVAVLPKAGDLAAQQVREQNLNQVFQAVVAVVLAPFPAIALTLLYYDLRVRREGLDMEAQAEAMNYPLAPDPFGGVADPKNAPRRRGRQG